MLDALNGKDWLEQYKHFTDPTSEFTLEELKEAYLQMTMNLINEIVSTKQLEEFVSEHYGEEQVEKLSVEGALSNRLIRILCQHPDDLKAQTDAAVSFIEYNVLK